MRWSISGDPVPDHLPYADGINRAFMEANFSPMFGYAVATEESIRGQIIGLWPDAATVVSPDGGYGCFQCTPSTSGFALPENWQDPYVAAQFAIAHWFNTSSQGGFPFWVNEPYNLTGDDLIRCVAASYNAGRQGAIDGHSIGNVDLNTENGNYATRVLSNYHKLAQGKAPWE